ncbi:MAG TPA: hypothetical protein VMK32_13965 [Burkholderiaceae bacterium]|nr:hypothetical protein [Burkholderiaceae bacterium]
MRRDVYAAWWKLAAHASEIAWTAPFVIGQRSARLLAAQTMRSAERREAVRMVSEKLDALQEAYALIWQDALAAQQRAWLEAWRAGTGGRKRSSSAQAADVLRNTAHLARRALRPIRRRAKSNARRLSPS